VTPADDPLLRRLHVGCGRNIKVGWINLDRAAAPGVDVVADLEGCRQHPLPFPDDHFDQVLAEHVIEHVHDALGAMQELHRITKPGGTATLRVPYGSHDDAFTDPTHVRPYFVESWAFFSQPNYWRADYGYRGDWRPDAIMLMMAREFVDGMPHAAINHAIRYQRNAVVEMIVEMTAIKPIRPPDRALQTVPVMTYKTWPQDMPSAAEPSSTTPKPVIRANTTRGSET
jgi:SAM-dependent methyltransferase